MADELPPLEQSPQGALSPEFVGQLEHSANWAQTFGQGDTNLAQRYRHNQDIAGAAAAAESQRAAAQAHLIQTNKVAQDFFFRAQKMDLDHQLAQNKIRHDAELYPLKIEAEKARTETMLAHDRAMTRAALVKEQAAKQQADDTEAFYTTIDDGLKKGVRVGTPEHAELVAAARIKAPAMRSDAFDDMWKTTASKQTPEEAIAQAVAKKKALIEVQPPPKPPGANKAELFQDAMVGGALSFGHLDEKGKLVPDADKDGKPTQATHVSSFYQDPATGRMVKTPPMTIGEFQTFQSKTEARRKTAPAANGNEPPNTPPTTTAAAPAPDGPRKVTSAQEFHDLPSGAEFIDPQGVKRRKP